MALKENSRKVFDYVKSVNGANITSADIAEALGLTKKQVDGIVTSAFQRHTEVVDGEKVPAPLMERIPAEIEVEGGLHKSVKFIRLTEAGHAFDPNASAE